MSSAILLISCPDRKGIVREIASFIADNDGNILHFDQHIDYSFLPAFPGAKPYHRAYVYDNKTVVFD